MGIKIVSDLLGVGEEYQNHELQDHYTTLSGAYPIRLFRGT